MSDRKGTGLTLLAGALIACAAFAAYANTFSAPFVFDAAAIVANNPTIRHMSGALHPPHDGSTVDGRPVLNFSLAANYAISGTGTWSYHAMNLAIHILAGLTLFGIVRRSLLLKSGRRKAESGSPGTDAVLNSTWIAFAIALLWTVHPLQTESVTYIIQRAESLMGLCYLLTLYCFIRGAELDEIGNRKAESENAEFLSAAEKIPLSAFRFSLWSAHLKAQLACRAWFTLSFIACVMGMGTKEVMVSAPVIVFLYDRTFIARSFGEAWRRRRAYYIALAATWIFLGFLVFGAANRHGTAGIGVDLGWSGYVLTQVYAVVHYLRLSLWPHPLVFDYGTVLVGGGKAFFPASILFALLAGTVAGLCSRSMGARIAGFLGAWFFAILAPTCLIPVATQTMAEHRMYLPLAAVVAGCVLIVENAASRLPTAFRFSLFGFLALCLGAATYARNGVYRSELALWSDTIGNEPDNDRAHNNLGNALYLLGRIPEAAEEYSRALRLRPSDNAEVQYNLGNCFLQEGRFAEAIGHYEEAVRLAPDNADARNNLGNALAQAGRLQEAMAQFQATLRLDPGRAAAHCNLGNVWYFLGHREEAMAEYREALRIDPNYLDARSALEHLQSQSPASASDH